MHSDNYQIDIIVFHIQYFYCAVVYLLHSLYILLALLNKCHIFLANITGLLAVCLHERNVALATVAESCPVDAIVVEVFGTGLLAVDGHPLDKARAHRAVAQIRPPVAGGIINVGVGTDCAEFAKLKAVSWNRNWSC
jgi:hypothetical protein